MKYPSEIFVLKLSLTLPFKASSLPYMKIGVIKRTYHHKLSNGISFERRLKKAKIYIHKNMTNQFWYLHCTQFDFFLWKLDSKSRYFLKLELIIYIMEKRTSQKDFRIERNWVWETRKIKLYPFGPLQWLVISARCTRLQKARTVCCNLQEPFRRQQEHKNKNWSTGRDLHLISFSFFFEKKKVIHHKKIRPEGRTVQKKKWLEEQTLSKPLKEKII